MSDQGRNKISYRQRGMISALVQQAYRATPDGAVATGEITVAEIVERMNRDRRPGEAVVGTGHVATARQAIFGNLAKVVQKDGMEVRVDALVDRVKSLEGQVADLAAETAAIGERFDDLLRRLGEQTAPATQSNGAARHG